MRELYINNFTTYAATNGWLRVFGWASLFTYTFFWLISSSIAKPGETLFIVFFISSLFQPKNKETNYLFYMALPIAFIVIQIITHYHLLQNYPELAENHLRNGRHYFKVFLCILVAYWLKGSIRGTKSIIALAVTGFMISLLFNSELNQWLSGLSGNRVGFNYVNTQHTAVFFGLSFIAALFWTLGNISNKKYFSMILSLVACVIFLVGTVITQTRAVWLAVFISIILATTFFIFINFKKKSDDKQYNKKILIAVPLILFVASLPLKPIIDKRMSAESHTISSLLKGDFEKISLGSVGIRATMWLYALEKIKERPLIGWGPETRKVLLESDALPKQISGKFDHFHNSYLDILVAYGVLGFIVIMLLTLQCVRGCFSLIRKGEVYLGIGLLSAWCFFGVVNIFESYITFSTARFFYMIVGGISLTHLLYKDSNHKRRLPLTIK